MASDEQTERRFQALEGKIDEVAALIRQGTPRSEERAEDILSRLPAEDRALLERHRFRTQYGPVLDEWLEEKMSQIESEADEIEDGDEDEVDEDEDGDEEEDEVEPPAAKKPRAAAKKRPKPRGGRHRSEPEDVEKPANERVEEPWWRRD